MQKTKKLLAVGLSCLTLMSSICIASCGEKRGNQQNQQNQQSQPIHQDNQTVVDSTCTSHSGRYECTTCQMNFGEEFKKIITENGSNGVFTNNGANYTQQTYFNDDFEIIMTFDSAVAGSAYRGYLSYSSFEKKWTWMLDWSSKTAMGEFEALSSASTSVPCSYSNFNTSVDGLMKEIFSTMVYNANQKLKEYNAGFTMENLGLKF